MLLSPFRVIYGLPKEKEANTMAKKIGKKLEKQFAEIAFRNICSIEDRGDLEVHNSDDEDFFEVSIWSLKDILMEAYELGLKEGKK